MGVAVSVTEAPSVKNSLELKTSKGGGGFAFFIQSFNDENKFLGCYE